MLRRLFTAASALSLLLWAVAIAVAWSATRANDARFIARNGTYWNIARNGAGGLLVWRLDWPRDEPCIWRPDSSRFAAYAIPGYESHRLGLVETLSNGYFVGRRDPWGHTPPVTGHVQMIYVPTWRWAVAFTVLPVVWAVVRIARRPQHGQGFSVEQPRIKSENVKR